MLFFFCRKHTNKRLGNRGLGQSYLKLYIYTYIYILFFSLQNLLRKDRCRGRDHLEKLIDTFSISATNDIICLYYHICISSWYNCCLWGEFKKSIVPSFLSFYPWSFCKNLCLISNSSMFLIISINNII